MEIRAAKIEDIPWIQGELKKFSDFMGTKLSLYGSDDFAHKTVAHLIAEPNVTLIAEKDGEPVGFISGSLSLHPFNPEIRLLAEYFWWVTESHRGSRAGMMLLDAFIAHGKKYADWITLSTEAKSSMADRHLLKRGFRLQEKGFLMEVL